MTKQNSDTPAPPATPALRMEVGARVLRLERRSHEGTVAVAPHGPDDPRCDRCLGGCAHVVVCWDDKPDELFDENPKHLEVTAAAPLHELYSEHRDSWHGTLTIGNLQAVADKLERLLKGKRYVFIACNALFGYRPDARVNQVLGYKKCRPVGKPVTAWFDDKNTPPRHGGLSVVDSYGVWSLSTSATNEALYVPKDAPVITFEYNRLRIEHTLGGGNRCWWEVVVTGDAQDTDR